MRSLVSFSGGMDSATLLALEVRGHGAENVVAVGFRYPSKHNAHERVAAERFCERYGVRRVEVDLSGAFAGFRSDLLQSGGAIPEGHYAAENMRATVVPCRNLIFASVLAGLAESLDCGRLVLGVHAGDHHIYPDCRPDFVRSLGIAVLRATDGMVDVEAPFLHVDKAEILRRGIAAGVPYHLTRTCYTDHDIACGRCGSCRERLEAFQKNGVEDPLVYLHRHQNPGDANA